MNTLRAGKLQFSISDDAKEIAWSADGLPLRESRSADFWRAYMDDNYRREMRVRSCLQTYGHVEVIAADHIVVHYDRMVGDDGREFDAAMHVHITANVSTYPGFEMYAEIDNHDDARLNELQLPMIDLDTACDTAREKDVMYRMNGYGDIQPNPWAAIKNNHTAQALRTARQGTMK